MIVLLRDYAGNINEVEIADDTQVIVGITIAGDQVMIYPTFYDSDNSGRWSVYLDNTWSIERKDFETIRNNEGKFDLSKIV